MSCQLTCNLTYVLNTTTLLLQKTGCSQNKVDFYTSPPVLTPLQLLRQVLREIAHEVVLRTDQLGEILHALKDASLAIRESLHEFLAMTGLGSLACVRVCVTGLLDNLRRYPGDRRSIVRCLRSLGLNHPLQVEALVPQLLLIHPAFDGVEPSVHDPQYLCKLILVLNACSKSPRILPLLEQHTLRHHAYLRDTHPNLTPPLLDPAATQQQVADAAGDAPPKASRNTRLFLQEALATTGHDHATLHSDLLKLASIDPELSAAANFAALYTRCTSLFLKVLGTRNLLGSPSVGGSSRRQASGALRASVEQLGRHTFRLRHAFTRLGPDAGAATRSMRVRTLALQLLYVVHGSTGSALPLCDNFLEQTEATHRCGYSCTGGRKILHAVPRKISLVAN